MKSMRRLLAAAMISLGFLLPISSVASVYAQPVDLLCINDDEQYTPTGCDLSLTQLVKVNSGEFTDPSTPASAVSVQNGDTVTFQITVADESNENVELPTGIVTVQDVFPAGVVFKSFSASVGDYNSDTNSWTFNVEESLPATLTLTGQVSTTVPGVISNTATLSDYTADNCDGPCEDPPYVDANAANNSHIVYLLINGKVVAVTVSGPGVPNTGFGVHHVNLGQELAIYVTAGTGLLAAAYAARRFSPKTR